MITLKRAAVQLGYDAGLFELIRFAVRRRQAVILMFHRFWGNGEGHPNGLPIGRFADFMAYLTRNYRVVSLQQITEELRRGTVQPCTAAVTIDDGYHEFFTLAAPVLRRYGVPASIFVVSDFIEGRLWPWIARFDFVFDHAPHERVEFSHCGRWHVLELKDKRERQQAREQWCQDAKGLSVADRDQLLDAIARAAGVDMPAVPPSEYRPMTWAQLRALAADGFDVGAHTRTHPILSGVSPEQLRAEVEGGKEQIESRLGIQVRHFAYPNGLSEDYTPEAVAAVARAGYLAAVTAVAGGNTPSTPPLELRRIAARPENLARFARCISGFDEIARRAGFGSDGRPARIRPIGEVAEGASRQ